MTSCGSHSRSAEALGGAAIGLGVAAPPRPPSGTPAARSNPAARRLRTQGVVGRDTPDRVAIASTSSRVEAQRRVAADLGDRAAVGAATGHPHAIASTQRRAEALEQAGEDERAWRGVQRGQQPKGKCPRWWTRALARAGGRHGRRSGRSARGRRSSRRRRRTRAAGARGSCAARGSPGKGRSARAGRAPRRARRVGRKRSWSTAQWMRVRAPRDAEPVDDLGARVLAKRQRPRRRAAPRGRRRRRRGVGRPRRTPAVRGAGRRCSVTTRAAPATRGIGTVSG